MDKDFVKMLTGKNPKDFEFASFHIINNSDVKTFEALVAKSDFLFDFIKQNVSKRLSNAVNKENYLNLLTFLNIYSSDYEDFIISSLVEFADEDLTDKMLNILEEGTHEQKAYAAKYFSFINDTLAIEPLKKNAFSCFSPLSANCAQALAAMQDKEMFDLAIKKLGSTDEFEKISAINFLTSYGDKTAIQKILETMKNSAMPENIAAEIPYLITFSELIEDSRNDTILALNHIINGLGEIIPISQVFDFQLFEIFEKLITENIEPKSAILLLNAKLKLEQLTENDEYMFDEDKNTKQEIFELKNLLNSQDKIFWEALKKQFLNELYEGSEFVFSALQLVQDLEIQDAFDKMQELLNSKNQTLILKTVEVIKSLNLINSLGKADILNKITDKNIKAIIDSAFS